MGKAESACRASVWTKLRKNIIQHQAMETGDPGAPGASVLAHVGEECSLPTAIATTLHLETVAATAQERGPYTALAMSHPAHLTVNLFVMNSVRPRTATSLMQRDSKHSWSGFPSMLVSCQETCANSPAEQRALATMWSFLQRLQMGLNVGHTATLCVSEESA